MGKKYTIELERGETAYKTVDSNGTPLIQLLAPTPYTEPDLEQVRKEAYRQGYDTGYGTKVNEFYEQGLIDARERKATCEFCEYEMRSDRDEPCRICACNYTNFFEPKKQDKEKQITKGDVIRIKSTPEIEILVTYADEEYVSGIALTEVDDYCEIGDQYTNIRICNVEKTGEHYEIAEVLAKMKESE